MIGRCLDEKPLNISKTSLLFDIVVFQLTVLPFLKCFLRIRALHIIGHARGGIYRKVGYVMAIALWTFENFGFHVSSRMEDKNLRTE